MMNLDYSHTLCFRLNWKTLVSVFFCFLYLSPGAVSQVPVWYSRGVGGGGALYSPSINPQNNNEFYVACDMSGVYHTADYGASYDMISFQQVVGGPYVKVQFTIDPLVRYSLHCANDQVVPVKSTDGGQTWHAVPGNPDPSEPLYSIFVDYNHPERIIISDYGTAYYSSNGGDSFSTIRSGSTDAGLNIGGVFFDTDTMYIGTNDGLIVSKNAGVSFTTLAWSGFNTVDERLFSFAGAREGSVLRFFGLTANEADVYVGVPGSDYWEFMAGVYVSENGSGSWTSCMNGITVGEDFPMYIAMAQNNISIAYLGGSNTSGAPSVIKTTNGGASWTNVFLSDNNQNISTGWSGDGGDRGWGYGECVFGITTALNDPNKVLITDFAFVHKTTNGGVSWQQAYLSSADENVPGQPTPPGKNYHGVGLENTSVWQVFWTDRDTLFACYTDIRGARSTDRGESWSFKYTGHTANTMYWMVQHPANGILYAATSGIHDLYKSYRLSDSYLNSTDAGGKVLYSTDKGASWNLIHSFGHPVYWLALDPDNPNRMYASVVHSTEGGIYVTENLQNGSSAAWTKLPNPPRTEGHPASIVVLKDSSVLCSYSGRREASGFTASSGVFLYSKEAQSWTDVSDPGMHYWTMDVVVDANDASENTWYACVFSGWGGPPNDLGGLYRTTNRGASWMRINDLSRVLSCTINPLDPDEMYLTTDASGLWHTASLNISNPVFTLVEEYPFGFPQRVFYNPYRQDEIWVTSFGAGMMVNKRTSAVENPGNGTIPAGVSLNQNYPNPFNPTTTMKYTLRVTSEVSLKIFDMLGREITTLMNGIQPAGEHTVEWNGRNSAGQHVGSGVYFYQLKLKDGYIETKKMVLMK